MCVGELVVKRHVFRVADHVIRCRNWKGMGFTAMLNVLTCCYGELSSRYVHLRGQGILPQSPRHHFSLTNYIKSIEQAITPAVLITKHIFVTYQNQGVITAPFPICVVSCVPSYCIAMFGLAEPIDRPILDDVDSNSDSKPRQSDRV